MIYYGINPVFESLRSPRCPKRVFMAAGKDSERLSAIRQAAAARDVPVETVRDLDQRCDSHGHQGVAAESPDLPPTTLDEAIAGSRRLVIFDSIQDPHNFGACLRVCDAFGFSQVIYHKGNSSGITPAAIKVSAGAIFHLRLCLSNLNTAVRRLRQEGYAIVALEAEGSRSLYEFAPPERYAVVVGSEDRGVRFAIQRLADEVLSIPMHGQVNSLNVSCALSAALAHLAR